MALPAVAAPARRRRARESAPDARRRTGLRLSHARTHDRADQSAGGQAAGKSASLSARTRFQREGSRSPGLLQILSRQQADDAARDDRARSRRFMPTRSAPNFSTSRIRASGIGCGTGSNRARRSITLRRRWRLRFCGCCSKSEAFEVFLHTRYVGQKRFSLQGAESLMVILDTILHRCPGDGIEEICMGMAHRGRLNVLANFLKKSLKVIFTEFSANYIPELVAGDGDVKYHLGYRTIRKLASGAEVEIRLAANPSHLEAVDPVVEGTRARGSAFAATPSIGGKFCRCSSTATRLSRARESWRKRSTCRSCTATAPAARCTSWSTTRSASPRCRKMRAPRCMHRHRQDDRGADLPRERRRSDRGPLCHRDWRSISARNLDATS